MTKNYTKICEIGYDEEGTPIIECSDDDELVLTLANKIHESLQNKDYKPMNILLGVTSHTLARVDSIMLRKYIKELIDYTNRFRKNYDDIWEGLLDYKNKN